MRELRACAWATLLAVAPLGCDSSEPAADESCGPSSATVTRVIDGDTVELDSGERVRYLLVDTPELGSEPDCYAEEAAAFNASIAEGVEVTLAYDVECADHYGRLLAYVTVDERDLNALLVERGYACVLQIPPNGEDFVDHYLALESAAQAGSRGMWGACPDITCGH